MMKTKENYTALVTEAGNGLGKTYANILLEHNYKAILASCGESYALLSEGDGHARGYERIDVDYTSDSALIQMYNTVEPSWGQLGLLINSAEIGNGFGQ